VRVLSFLKAPVSALSAMFVPLCAELYSTGQLERLRSMFLATASCGIRVAIPLICGGFLFAEPVMAIYGPEFVQGGWTLSILGTSLIANCYGVLAGYAVYMAGRTWLVTLNQAFLAVVSVGLYFLLIPSHGIEGAAVARTCAWALWAAFVLLQAGKVLGFGLLSYAAVWALQRVDLVRENLALVILSGILFVALYVRLVSWLGLTEDEKMILGKLGRKLAKLRRRPA
jgi:O-antigen/teichoic acid export membrane protein